MKSFLREHSFSQKKYVLNCDSQSAIQLGKNSTFHGKSKHIDVRYHWIRNILGCNLIEFNKIHTDDNASDMMTKSLPKSKFNACCLITEMAISST